MKSILEYKGYHAKVEIDIENKILYGKIEGDVYKRQGVM